MPQRPVIDPGLAERIQKYANEHHNGNFTAAVRALVEKGLSQ